MARPQRGGRAVRNTSHTMKHELLQAVTTRNNDLLEEVLGSNRIVMEALLKGITAEGNSALHIAASHGFLELVEMICHMNGSLIKAMSNYFDTPLICAARAGHDDVVSHLISLVSTENKLDEALLRASNADGATAMHEAVSNGHFTVLKTLVLTEASLGATVNARGVSPLYLAVLSGRADMVNLLIEQSPKVLRSPAYYSGPDGKTALHAAVLVSEDMTKSMRLWQPMLTRRGDDFGNTALHYAISDGRIGVVNLLLEDSTLAYLPNCDGLFPVHIAAIVGHAHIVDQLFKLCPNCDELLDNKGRNALHCAIEHGRMKVVRNICKTPSFTKMINTRDKQGNTPLHLAIKHGFKSMAVLIMLDIRVSLNIMNNEGLTPLDVAIYECDQCTSHAASIAAVFTVPGGYIAEGENVGVPVLSKMPEFMSFMEFTFLAFEFSIVAIVLLLCASVPDISERDRRHRICYPLALYARPIYSQFGLLFAALLGHRLVQLLKQLRSRYPWQDIFCILSSVVFYALINNIPVSQVNKGLPWQSSHNWHGCLCHGDESLLYPS
uniref:PGG domain-containing protein n=1 Tax=Leersia perrieri TaxID=77586 RepID=A0A0D9WGS9_9ORYZ